MREGKEAPMPDRRQVLDSVADRVLLPDDRWKYDDVVCNDGEDAANNFLLAQMESARTRTENPISEAEEAGLLRQLADTIDVPKRKEEAE